MDDERTQAKGAHLIARGERLWVVEPKMLTENSAKFLLNEVVGVSPDVMNGNLEETAQLAKVGRIMGDFSFTKSDGNAVTLTAAKRLQDMTNSTHEDYAMMRVLSERRIDTHLARESGRSGPVQSMPEHGKEAPKQIIGTAARLMDKYDSDKRARLGDDAVEHGVGTEQRAGLLGGLRRMFAGAPEPGVAEEKAALLADKSIEGRFAAEIAHRFAGRPMEELTKVMPEAWRKDGLPADRDAAFVAIAKTARGVADRYMETPMPGLDQAHAREAKEQVLVAALVFNKSGDKSVPPSPYVEKFSDTIGDHSRIAVQLMRQKLNPEIAPKPMRPGPQQATEVARASTPSKGAVVAMHMQHAGQAR